MLQHQGKVSRYIRYMEIESINEEILLPLKDELFLSKGVILEFDIKEGESHVPFNICMETFLKSVNMRTEFVSFLNENKEIKEGFCFCRVLITGINNVFISRI